GDPRFGGVPMGKRSLILLALPAWAVVLAVGAAHQPAPEPRPPVNPAVQALLDRAAKEPPAAALGTLAEAERPAGGDRAGLLAVAQVGDNVGMAAASRGELAAAKALWERVLAIRAKQAPGSYEHAGTLVNLGIVAYRQRELVNAGELYGRALAILERV